MNFWTTEPDPWLMENGFYWTSPVQRIGKLLAHYELYKRIVDIPGAVVECGVHKGASLIRWATFRETLETEASRQLIGMDAFGRFPIPSAPDDATFAHAFAASAGEGLSVAELEEVFRRKGFGNYTLIEGDVRTTSSELAESRPELRIAMLHLDLDVEDATRAVLAALSDRLVRGGLILVDDYGAVTGATRATEEWLRDRSELRLEKLPIAHLPAYMRVS